MTSGRAWVVGIDGVIKADMARTRSMNADGLCLTSLLLWYTALIWPGDLQERVLLRITIYSISTTGLFATSSPTFWSIFNVVGGGEESAPSEIVATPPSEILVLNGREEGSAGRCSHSLESVHCSSVACYVEFWRRCDQLGGGSAEAR